MTNDRASLVKIYIEYCEIISIPNKYSKIEVSEVNTRKQSSKIKTRLKQCRQASIKSGAFPCSSSVSKRILSEICVVSSSCDRP